jgi:guanosine-3',5'-bis(diphosphate) 3'-pyrophosphohydrolase
MNETTILLNALSFAAEKHKHQKRKDTLETPYINHPIALAHVLCSSGITDVHVLQAALLHDTIEDTETIPEDLTESFGEKVAAIVLEVTDNKSLEKAHRKELEIAHAPHLSKEAALVKIADKICNLRDIANNPPADWSEERKREYFDWAKKVVDRLSAVDCRILETFKDVYSGKSI